jgi:hypothetical protein
MAKDTPQVPTASPVLDILSNPAAEQNSSVQQYLAIQTRLAEIQIRRDEEERAERARQLEQHNKIRESGAKASKEQMDRELRAQAQCKHTRTEDGQPNLVANRTWTDKYILNCGTCGLTVIGTRRELIDKYGFFPRDNEIGGPLPPGTTILNTGSAV